MVFHRANPVVDGTTNQLNNLLTNYWANDGVLDEMPKEMVQEKKNNDDADNSFVANEPHQKTHLNDRMIGHKLVDISQISKLVNHDTICPSCKFCNTFVLKNLLYWVCQHNQNGMHIL